MSTPFLLFPWSSPFLPQFKAYIDSHRISAQCIPLILSSTARPWQYMSALYAKDKQARVLPRMMAINEAITFWHIQLKGSHLREANLLDKIALLYAVLHDLDLGSRGGSALSAMSLEQFFPWGAKLANLIDELLMNGIMPQDILATPEDVLEYASLLLQSLSSIGQCYLERLADFHLTTSALRYYEVAQNLERNQELPEFLQPSENNPIYIVGFHTLKGSVNTLFKHLWQQGAQVCLHSDPKLIAWLNAPKKTRHDVGMHWICERQGAWILDWHAQATLIADPLPIPPKSIDFLSGYDLHSQLEQLQLDLTQRGPGTAAVILPSPSILMPLLHHLPPNDRSNVNIIMGCPLTEAPVCQLIRDLLKLQAKRDGNGRYYWKNLQSCFNASLFGGIRTPQGTSIKQALTPFQKAIRQGARFSDPYAVLESPAFLNQYTDPARAKADQQALQELFFVVINGFEHLRTCLDLAQALRRFCDYMRLHLTPEFRFQARMDMEAIYRLEYTVIPVLHANTMASTALESVAIETLFQLVISSENLFFEPEGDKLAGLQIMGLFESTLLSFDHVYLVDATDDLLPGSAKHDALLPDSLRALSGLPEHGLLDQEKGYVVHRLCASSGAKHFYWQEGISRSSTFDGKKSKSRFVEELIWEQELKEGHVLRPGQGSLRVAACTLTPMQAQARPLPSSMYYTEQALEQVKNRKLSPTMLDTYLRCPASFFYRTLAHLSPINEINEGDDAAGVGKFMHRVLETFHKRYLQRPLPDKQHACEELLSVFDDLFTVTDCDLQTLHPESLAMFTYAARKKLRSYIENQPSDSISLLVETEFSNTIKVRGQLFHLRGRLDRLDQRIPGLILLDYKTGQIPSIPSELWENSEFFERCHKLIQADRLDQRELDNLFLLLHENATSIQLPCYLTMANQVAAPQLTPNDGSSLLWPQGDVYDAAFVQLADSGDEKSFFPQRKKDPDARKQALANCHLLVELVLTHMTQTSHFIQLPDRDRCARCEYVSLCHS